MELVERAYGVSVFGAHAAACVDGVLPAFDVMRARQNRVVMGKAIVFAREDVVTGDTRSWLTDGTIRDVPKPGERIAAGHPICTVFAGGASVADCEQALKRRAVHVFEGVAPLRQTNP
jgi:predicted ATP-grasp superfamily ATP-dependent carboligase